MNPRMEEIIIVQLCHSYAQFSPELNTTISELTVALGTAQDAPMTPKVTNSITFAQ